MKKEITVIFYFSYLFHWNIQEFKYLINGIKVETKQKKRSWSCILIIETILKFYYVN